MYRRADLSRTFQLVVALSLTSAATGVFAREFRAADTQNKDDPTVQAPGYLGSLIAGRSDGRCQIEVSLATPQEPSFSVSPGEQNIFHEAASAGIYARLHRAPAMTRSIERIREVE